MASLGQYALPGIIVLSALGALIMCLLVFRYGFTAPGEEDLDEAAHRLFVTRFGHALVGVCFAAVAMLAVVAFSAQTRAARVPAPGVGEATAAETVRQLEERVDRRLTEMEERLSEVAATVERAAARTEPAVASPPPAPLPARRPEPAAARPPAPRGPVAPSAAVSEDDVSALAADGDTNHLRTTVQGIDVDVLSGAGRAGHRIYAVRLTDIVGRPLAGADVALVARMADGSTRQVPLNAAGEPGLYRGRVTGAADKPTDLRLRVVASHRRFEVALDQAVSW